MTPEQLLRLETLERQMRDHAHNSTENRRVSFRDIQGKIEVVSTAPIGNPTDVGAQLKIYTNGATLRFYWYDTTAGVWHFVTATA